jgi:hypothetical protein
VRFQKQTAVGGLLALALTACGSSATAPPTQTKNNPLLSRIQFGVGTANIFGDVASAGMKGLNVVVTLRQPPGAQHPGDTGALVNTPQVSGPMTLPSVPGVPDAFGATVQTGPCGGASCAVSDVGGSTMHATPQQNPGANSPPSTFGISGNASGWAIEPFNYSANPSQGFGVPDSFTPWNVPLFDVVSGDVNAFTPWGGPPAFDPNHDGKGTRDNSGFPPGVFGVEEGLDVFAGVTVHAGSYKLSAVIPTGPTSNGTLAASAVLHSTALLQAIFPPGVTLDGTGGGSFTLTLPPRATEGYVQILDIGPQSSSSAFASCNGSDQLPIYYTIVYHGTGPGTLPATDGPGNPGTKTPSLCTPAQNAAANGASSGVPGDSFFIQSIGFDYPVYEASYPQSLGNPTPTIFGSAGQTDITISSALVVAQPASGDVVRMKPQAAQRMLARLHHRLPRTR